MYCLSQEVERGFTSLCARGNRGPDSLAPCTAVLATRSLGDFAVDHDETDGLLRPVVGRLDTGSLDELEVCGSIRLEAGRDVLGLAASRRAARLPPSDHCG